MPPLKIVFFGTPSFVLPLLQALIADGRFQVVFAVTQAAKPAGRAQVAEFSPVAVEARKHGIPVLTPETLRDETVVNSLRSLQADLFVVDAYGKILPKAVLDLPKHGCVNLHPSLLPKYRGATPVPFALLHGDTETGMTFMRMSEGMDEGDLLLVLPAPILPTDDASTLLTRLNTVAAERIGDLLTEYAQGNIVPIPQDHTQATYSTLLTKDHGRIDWSTETAIMIVNKLRAFTPWPGIFTFYGDKRLKILECEAGENRGDGIRNTGNTLPPGYLIAPDLVVTTEGLLRLVTVQLEGKKPVPFGEFIKGIREKDVRFV